MQSILYKNELAKRAFYKYLENAKRFSPKSIECYEKAIWLWEKHTNKADFKLFNQTRAENFKDWLKNKKKKDSQNTVSLSYCYDILRYLKVFFEWLSKQTNYRKINPTAIDYLNLTRGEVRIATQPKTKQCPTVDEVETIIENIKGKTEIEMRDKALISLMFLTSARISAIISLSMECFNKEQLTINQDPKLGVKTKNSKRFITALIPFSYKEPLKYFLEWFDYLEKEKGFKPTDPIFPATKKENGKNNLSYFSSTEVEPIFWKSNTSARKIVENRSKQAEVKYYNPHSYRDLLVKEISKLPLTQEQKKAYSQNLGHEKVGTTFGSYGDTMLDDDRQIEIIKQTSLTNKQGGFNCELDNTELLRLLAEKLRK